MSESFKVLGQAAPSINTLTALYTVPAATSTTISSITICNSTSSTIKFRVSIAVANAADSLKQYIFYDVSIIKNNSIAATLGITLAATDVVKVYSDTANVAFNLFGVELT